MYKTAILQKLLMFKNRMKNIQFLDLKGCKIMCKKNKKYTIIIDNDILNQYTKYYFLKYPRRKKEPISKPITPSINQWMVMLRPQMNKVKQDWKEFMVWVVDFYGYTNANIQHCNMELNIYFDTKRRHDSDNYSPKFINDGLTESGMLVDDDFNHIHKLTISGGYDKLNPRMEIILTEIDIE